MRDAQVSKCANAHLRMLSEYPLNYVLALKIYCEGQKKRQQTPLKKTGKQTLKNEANNLYAGQQVGCQQNKLAVGFWKTCAKSGGGCTLIEANESAILVLQGTM